LKINGFLDESERIDVLDLGSRAELARALGPHTDVGIAAKVAFLKIPITDPKRSDDGIESTKVRSCFRGRTQIRTAHDLDQRDTRAVEIDQRRIGAVNAFSRILFHVDPPDADSLRA